MAHFLLRNTLLSDRRLPMPGRVVVFGSTLDADVPIQHESVSERHALLEAAEEGYMISDLGSAEGTFVGERRLSPGERLPLAEGGAFVLGKIAIILSPDEEIPPAEPEEMHLEPEAEAALDPTPAAPALPVQAPKRADKREEKSTRVPAARRRAARLRTRRNVFFWAGIAVTVILLALAAFFIYRIASQKGKSDAKQNVEHPAR